jgi:competence protein ComEC
VVIERIEARAIPWVNTATCGAAIWRSDAPAELRCERWRERHYWQQLDRAASSAD